MNNNFSENIDRITRNIGDSIQYVIANIGKAGLPIISGFLYSITIYQVFFAVTDDKIISSTAAIIFAFGLESVGFNASRNMIKNITPFSIILFGGYILIGGFSLWFTDVEHIYMIVTSSAFTLTAINYILYGIQEKESNAIRQDDTKRDTVTQNGVDTEQRDYERKQAEKQTRFENKLRVEKMRGLGNVTKKNGTKVYDKTVTTNNNNTPQTNGNSTNRVPFKSLTTHDKTEMAQMTINDIVTKYNISKRTAHRWVKQIQE